MATPMDISLVKQFDFVFPFLLVFVMVYAGLGFMKAFKDNKALHAMLALVLAFMTLFSPIAVKTITFMSPMFVILIIFLMFLLLSFMVLGPTESDIMNVLKTKEHQFVLWWIAAFVILIGFGSFFMALAESGGVPGYAGPGGSLEAGAAGGATAGGQQADFFKTLFHPKVLGLIFIILLGLFTINRLASATVE